MREGIHPEYYQATVTCNCGNTFVTGSTKQEIHVEICSKCHPFFTGQQKAVSARGRVDKFNKKYGFTSEEACPPKMHSPNPCEYIRLTGQRTVRLLIR